MTLKAKTKKAIQELIDNELSKALCFSYCKFGNELYLKDKIEILQRNRLKFLAELKALIVKLEN